MRPLAFLGALGVALVFIAQPADAGCRSYSDGYGNTTYR